MSITPRFSDIIKGSAVFIPVLHDLGIVTVRIETSVCVHTANQWPRPGIRLFSVHNLVPIPYGVAVWLAMHRSDRR